MGATGPLLGTAFTCGSASCPSLGTLRLPPRAASALEPVSNTRMQAMPAITSTPEFMSLVNRIKDGVSRACAPRMPGDDLMTW